MTAVIHLVRHGETVWHAENRYAGRSDVELTGRGRAQAADLAHWATGAGLIAVWSSDLDRAVRTAAAAASAAGIDHRIDPALREADFGRGEGLTRAEMAAAFPAELASFLATPSSTPLPGGEPGAAVADRFTAALRRLADPAGPVLVVAHTTAIRLALSRLLGLPLDDYRRRFPRLGNTALTTLELGDDPASTALIRFNAVI